MSKQFQKSILLVCIFLLILIISAFLFKFISSEVIIKKTTTILEPSLTPSDKTLSTEDWQYFDNQCFSIQYPSSWKYESDNAVDNMPNTGIGWVDIFFDSKNNKNIMKITLINNGTVFNIANYKNTMFPNTTPRSINNKKVYSIGGKYLLETNCNNTYILIDILDLDARSTLEKIVGSLN